MAHFAQLVNNVVSQVLVVDNKDCGNLEFPESESIGQQYLSDCGFGNNWKQTSYNGNFRGKFAGTGMMYDDILDEFVVPVNPVTE